MSTGHAVMEPDRETEPGGHGGSPSLGVADYWWYRVRSELLRIVFAPRLGAPQRLLDVGSADGPSVSWLDAQLKVSLDCDPRGLSGGGVCGSALALPFGDQSFDVVSALDVIEHLDPEHTALSELGRVLRPGGLLLVAVPAYQWAWTRHDEANGHHRRYTRRRLVRAVSAAGFQVERATYAFTGVFPLFAVQRLTDRMLHRRQAVGGEASKPADIASVPPVAPLLDRLLCGLSTFDARMLRHHDLPYGSSVFLVATKAADRTTDR